MTLSDRDPAKPPEQREADDLALQCHTAIEVLRRRKKLQPNCWNDLGACVLAANIELMYTYEGFST